MSDLDDFFAKKTKKKKSKNSSAVLAGDLLNQKKEQEVRKARKLKEKDEKSTEPLSSLLKKTEEDEEWNDMEAEREPTAADLSKIQNLTISRDTEPSRDEDRSNGNEGEDAVREEGDRMVAAWGLNSETNTGNVSDGDESSTHSGSNRESALPSAPLQTPHSNDCDNELKGGAAIGSTSSARSDSKPATQTYVPPHLRSRNTGSGAGSDFTLQSKRSVKKPVKAPDIGNVEEFPTLGGGPATDHGEQNDRDSQVRGSAALSRTHNSMNTASKARGYTDNADNWRSRDSRGGQNSRFGGGRYDGGRAGGRNETLTLENRYSTLSDDY